MPTLHSSEDRRKRRTRYKILKLARKNKVHRLSVHKSNMHVYAQIIDDTNGATIASTSTLAVAKDKAAKKVNMSNKASAAKIGKEIAKLATKHKVKKVIFDRGSARYHGVIREIAESARSGGLEF